MSPDAYLKMDKDQKAIVPCWRENVDFPKTSRRADLQEEEAVHVEKKERTFACWMGMPDMVASKGARPM